MVLRRGLGEPHVAGIAGKLPALARPRDRVAVADLAARRVDQVGAAFHLGDQLLVEHVLRLRVQRCVDRDHVARLHERLGVVVEGDAELLLDLGREAMAVGVVQPGLERLQAAQHRRADASGGHGPDLHALQVVGARGAVGDVPPAAQHPFVRGDVVAHQREDHHHDVLRDADAVRVGHLGNRHPAFDRGLQVDVIRADPRRHGELQLRSLGDALGHQVCRPERL